MRRLLALALSSIPLFIGVACSSSDDDSGSASGGYEPAGNGVPISESLACDGLTDAAQARRLALQCGPSTSPACPGFLQKQKGTPACSQYDQGALQACVAYISKLATCNEIAKKPCIVKPIPGSAPNGCVIVEAGVDAGQDAGQDSGQDAGQDAAEDTTVEDAAPDVVEAGDDASASDAASE